jgi:succinate dehydrogenase / fumarate reductase cytochrome b subunit
VNRFYKKPNMSKSAILRSSIAKKYWMALTGLFLCTFLIGHLLGNLQLLGEYGEESKRAFNEYAYFMGHNIFIKILSYVTYISILFHVIDGFLLVYQNRKARPQKYAYNNPGANSSTASRYMAVLGTMILIFIVTHMANFWWKMKITQEIPLHTYMVYPPLTDKAEGEEVYYTLTKQPIPVDQTEIKNHTEIYLKDMSKELAAMNIVPQGENQKLAEGYKDLYTVTVDFFSKKNEYGLVATILYVLAMLVLAFHLWHGFASAFQSLGVRHKRYTPMIQVVGKAFAILVPLAFAVIPLVLYLR